MRPRLPTRMHKWRTTPPVIGVRALALQTSDATAFDATRVPRARGNEETSALLWAALESSAKK